MTDSEQALAIARAFMAAKRDGLTYAQAHHKTAAMPYKAAAVADHDLRAVWDSILPLKPETA